MRTFDTRFLNEVANHPDVRPHLGLGEGAIDLAAVLSHVSNYALVNDEGGFVLSPNAPGVYEVHSMFLPGSETAIPFMLEAQEWMFTRTDCVAITSKVPKSNRAAKGFAIAGGLAKLFERDDASLGPTEYVELPVLKWAMGNEGLEAHGERFHNAIEAAKAARGSELPVHPHDPAHERAVGAALLMIERGQAAKGVAFYNRWAVLAGYAEVRLVSANPVTVDVVDAVVGLNASGLEVQLCR